MNNVIYSLIFIDRAGLSDAQQKILLKWGESNVSDILPELLFPNQRMYKASLTRWHPFRGNYESDLIIYQLREDVFRQMSLDGLSKNDSMEYIKITYAQISNSDSCHVVLWDGECLFEKGK